MNTEIAKAGHIDVVLQWTLNGDHIRLVFFNSLNNHYVNLPNDNMMLLAYSDLLRKLSESYTAEPNLGVVFGTNHNYAPMITPVLADDDKKNYWEDRAKQAELSLKTAKAALNIKDNRIGELSNRLKILQGTLKMYHDKEDREAFTAKAMDVQSASKGLGINMEIEQPNVEDEEEMFTLMRQMFALEREGRYQEAKVVSDKLIQLNNINI